MRRKLLMLLALMIGLLGLGTVSVTAHAQSVGFVVQPVLPSNQVSQRVGYFDLRVSPGQRQRLGVTIKNTSNQAQRFAVSVNQAVTNDNGVIDYSQLNPKLDASLQVGTAAIFTKASTQTVSVPANTDRRIYLTYTMPKKRLRGMILGGIYVRQLTSNQTKATGKILLKNVFTYAIGVELSESHQAVAPAMRLHQIQATQINRRNYVAANLQNPEPGIMQQLTIDARVSKAGQTRTLLHQKQTALGMAPNSNFNFGIPWNNQNLPAGQYTLRLTARAGQQHWQFTRNFTIANKTVARLNKTVLTPTKQPNYWLYFLLGLIIALLLAIIGYLIYRRRQDQNAK